MNVAAVMSSQAMDWRTPTDVLDVVRKLGPIGLDPCSGPGSHVNAETEWSPPEHDGLIASWGGHGLVFVNPPYGRDLDAWCEKAGWEGAVARLSRRDEVLLLVTSRTDTARFHEVLANADALCFWRGRISFLRPDGSTGAGAAFPSLVAYWGRRKYRFAEVFEPCGWVALTRTGG